MNNLAIENVILNIWEPMRNEIRNIHINVKNNL